MKKDRLIEISPEEAQRVPLVVVLSRPAVASHVVRRDQGSCRHAARLGGAYAYAVCSVECPLSASVHDPAFVDIAVVHAVAAIRLMMRSPSISARAISRSPYVSR